MSYRAYVPQFLDRIALKEKNRNAPEGQKFCNAICQDYLPKTSFSSVHVLCNSCRNRIHLAEKQVASQKISMQDFHKDPMVVYKTHPDGVLITKACIVCKNDKAIFQYEPNRKECKSCHGLQTAARARENVSDYITDIENIKTHVEQLEVYLEHIPKDTLILLIAHYQVGRKASDVKSTMVHNMVQHFRALLSPEKCQGGCGVSVVEPHSKCGTCQEKPIVHKNEKRQQFIDNLDTLVDSLEPMRNRALDVDRFNKDQLTMVARKLGLKFEQKIPKNDLFDLVNEALETRQVERENERAVEEKGRPVDTGMKEESFEKGPCFYIIRMNNTDFRLGYEGFDVNIRFKAYRSANPSMRVCHIVYSVDSFFIEQTMMKRFQCKKLKPNHDVVTDVSLHDLIDSVHFIVEFFHSDYHIVSEELLETFNNGL